MLNGLTPRQLNFVNAYIKNKGNRVAAVKAAGLATTDGSAAVIASRLLKNVNVMEKINEESRMASEAVKLDKTLVMRELSRIITMGKKDSDRIAAIKVWAEMTGANEPRSLRIAQELAELPRTPEEIDEMLIKMRKSVGQT
jgi:phage terminase small subunit